MQGFWADSRDQQPVGVDQYAIHAAADRYLPYERMRVVSGETNLAEETLREVVAGAGPNPLHGFARDCPVDVLSDAMHMLPPLQREVVEAQTFEGLKEHRALMPTRHP
jgi:DNA-directed RNA polymerase specialized sigma24 family protein